MSKSLYQNRPVLAYLMLEDLMLEADADNDPFGNDLRECLIKIWKTMSKEDKDFLNKRANGEYF